MKFLNALALNKKQKDSAPAERYEVNMVYTEIDKLCQQYLRSEGDILTIEFRPDRLQACIAAVELPKFQERYLYTQVSEELFQFQLRGLDLYE